jgi:hypothetical protein
MHTTKQTQKALIKRPCRQWDSNTRYQLRWQTKVQDWRQCLHEGTGLQAEPARKYKAEDSACTKVQDWRQCLHESTGLKTVPAQKYRTEDSACAQVQDWRQCLYGEKHKLQRVGWKQKPDTRRSYLPYISSDSKRITRAKITSGKNCAREFAKSRQKRVEAEVCGCLLYYRL